jgi:hypothetical protein
VTAVFLVTTDIIRLLVFLGLGGSESDDNKRLNGSMKRMMISAVQRHFVNMTIRQMLREPV